MPELNEKIQKHMQTMIENHLKKRKKPSQLNRVIKDIKPELIKKFNLKETDFNKHLDQTLHQLQLKEKVIFLVDDILIHPEILETNTYEDLSAALDKEEKITINLPKTPITKQLQDELETYLLSQTKPIQRGEMLRIVRQKYQELGTEKTEKAIDKRLSMTLGELRELGKINSPATGIWMHNTLHLRLPKTELKKEIERLKLRTHKVKKLEAIISQEDYMDLKTLSERNKTSHAATSYLLRRAIKSGSIITFTGSHLLELEKNEAHIPERFKSIDKRGNPVFSILLNKIEENPNEYNWLKQLMQLTGKHKLNYSEKEALINAFGTSLDPNLEDPAFVGDLHQHLEKYPFTTEDFLRTETRLYKEDLAKLEKEGQIIRVTKEELLKFYNLARKKLYPKTFLRIENSRSDLFASAKSLSNSLNWLKVLLLPGVSLTKETRKTLKQYLGTPKSDYLDKLENQITPINFVQKPARALPSKKELKQRGYNNTEFKELERLVFTPQNKKGLVYKLRNQFLRMYIDRGFYIPPELKQRILKDRKDESYYLHFKAFTLPIHALTSEIISSYKDPELFKLAYNIFTQIRNGKIKQVQVKRERLVKPEYEWLRGLIAEKRESATENSLLLSNLQSEQFILESAGLPQEVVRRLRHFLGLPEPIKKKPTTE